SHLDVVGVVLSGKRGAAVPWMLEIDDADRVRASELLERFGCGHLRGQSLAACSQGERQRVLLARALFGRPELVLLDEPAAGLDLPGREGLVRALERDDELGRIPTILVTHHVEEVPASVTHAALLRDGRVVASGPISSVLTDANLGECFGMAVSVERVRGRWTIAP
ncbi:MAG TPA: ATP-binding cassette domain-containing protein, partial [Terriglobales bacterium]|nr:ATP-binding cassette domain-containing protein [Terriglobales bacterium]